MYSIVMLMAMSSGGEVADCHRGRGRHGGNGGCYGGCNGGCYGGCYGGLGRGCYGGCYGGGCYGVSNYGCGGCYGGTAVKEKAAPAEEQNKGVSRAAPAKLIVSLPANAELSINGTAAKKSDKTRRGFVSPNLPSGRDYYYNLKVVVTRDGKSVTVEKRVTVRAGSKVNVDLASHSSLAMR